MKELNMAEAIVSAAGNLCLKVDSCPGWLMSQELVQAFVLETRYPRHQGLTC